jgi:Cof subfamily protein (haloacid dehalogenase superfamily)
MSGDSIRSRHRIRGASTEASHLNAAPYRMIAIDLDGTLLSPYGEVTPRAKAAVHACLSAGLLVCFATGRNRTESRTVIDAVAHYDTAVFVGGAMVVDTRQRMTLHRTMMDPSLAAAICGYFEGSGQAALAMQDPETAGVDYLVSANVPVNGATAQWMDVTAAKISRVPSLATHPHDHTVRVGIVAPPEQTQAAKRHLDARYADRIMVHSLFVPAYGVEVLEVFDPSVNKWAGLLHVAKRHGIDPEQIVAIGDDLNDLAMIEHAGLGVAMGNARPEVLAIADRVIGSNADEGLAAFLEELVAAHAVEPLGGEPGDARGA